MLSSSFSTDYEIELGIRNVYVKLTKCRDTCWIFQNWPPFLPCRRKREEIFSLKFAKFSQLRIQFCAGLAVVNIDGEFCGVFFICDFLSLSCICVRLFWLSLHGKQLISLKNSPKTKQSKTNYQKNTNKIWLKYTKNEE